MPLHQRASQRQRRLRITAQPTFARQILVPHRVKFTQMHPLVELGLVLSVPYLDAAISTTISNADVETRNGALRKQQAERA